MKEIIWKDLPNYEEYYEVSNTGEVRNKATKVVRQKTINKGREVVIMPNYDSSSVRTKTVIVSRAVAQAFPEICGDWFEECEVHHKDKNPLNNKAENLLCLSQKEHKKLHNFKKKKTFPYMFS